MGYPGRNEPFGRQIEAGTGRLNGREVPAGFMLVLN